VSKQSEKPLRDLLAELDDLMSWFDQDDFDIEEGFTKFQSGMELVKTINTRLGSLEHKVTVLKERFDQA
jgi:exonuclease VII small subunit